MFRNMFFFKWITTPSLVFSGKLILRSRAAWTTKFLHRGGSFWDLPSSIKPHNWLTLLKVGIGNLPLVGYLVQQGIDLVAAGKASIKVTLAP